MKNVHINSKTNPPINFKGNNRSTPIKNTFPRKFWYGRKNHVHVHQHKNNLKKLVTKRMLQFQLKGKSLNTVSAIHGKHRVSIEVALKKLVDILWNSKKQKQKQKKKRKERESIWTNKGRRNKARNYIKPIKSIKKG